MKNIHIIPTSQPSRLWTNNLKRRLEFDDFPEFHPTNIAKHLYITNSEEIKEGDYYLYGIEIIQANGLVAFHPTIINACKKIILTTDQDLIADGVQPIDDEFLEWFVKNPSCEEVEIDDKLLEKGYTYYRENILKNKNLYKIIIPKEELSTKLHKGEIVDESYPKEFKQETLEEVAERIGNNFEDSTFKSGVIYGVIEGAKWQSERMYSEEETLEDIKLEEVVGSKHCLYSVIENKLSVLYRNQEQILKAIKMLNNGRQ